MVIFWRRNKPLSKQESATQSPTNQRSVKLPLTFLKRLVPIGRLTDVELLQLRVKLIHYQPGEVIFNQDEKIQSLPYLIEGQCFLEHSNGNGYPVEASTFKAFYPLSSDYHSHCIAIAKTEVSIAYFSKNILQQSNGNVRNPLINREDIPDCLQNNAFFNSFCQQFKANKLTIPSLPDVALKLRRAVQQDVGIKEAVKIINLDPIISSKLIQIVNSPVYRTANPISNCHDAVTRLGLTTTRNLVTSISMQNLFRSQDKVLNKRVHSLWKQSIHVSCISHTLALLMTKINPDEALLAGLIHNIGVLPIIIFADSLPKDSYTIKDIDLVSKTLQNLIGDFILGKWHFPDNLKVIPSQVDNWYHNSDKPLTLSDLVILAKFHSYMGSQQMQYLPLIHTLPAFQKLGDHTLTPDMSLQTLHNARQQINEAMSLFSQ